MNDDLAFYMVCVLFCGNDVIYIFLYTRCLRVNHKCGILQRRKMASFYIKLKACILNLITKMCFVLSFIHIFFFHIRGDTTLKKKKEFLHPTSIYSFLRSIASVSISKFIDSQINNNWSDRTDIIVVYSLAYKSYFIKYLIWWTTVSIFSNTKQ